jgi:hypothetical protein
MNNYILITEKEINDIRLNFISRSKLNGKLIYEILLNKINKEDVLNQIFNCDGGDIITNPTYIDLHIPIYEWNKTQNLLDFYDYKNRVGNF